MSSNHRPLDESDILLIRTIRDTPSLYDPQLPSFRLSQRKEEDWAKVAEVLNISIMDARRRWTCLRDRYSRELKQKRLHPSGEFGHNDFFRKMDFLRSFVRKRRERRGRDRERDPKPHVYAKTRRRRVWISSVGMPLENDPIIEEPSSQEFDEQQYDAKLEVQTTQSETYSVLVEADEGQEPDQESFKEFLDTESEHKSMQSHTVVIHPEPATMKGSSPAVEAVDPAHGDVNYVVCMPNQEREQFTTESVTPVAPATVQSCSETADDFFCKSIAAYLRQLSRVHKIKAKVEMYQILEKYILLEESGRAGSG
ncbi:hypothetical protein KR026_009574 [Drosophila bipectinata]|nr:hypothetical protein KR026_009574 [Drosophila bipectinata]